MTKWESYEEVAVYLLNQFAIHFGLERVESKQKIVGLRSGTVWEIDAKGVREGNTGFILIECRRHTTSRQRQEDVAALAYRIQDTGAEGGIIVSPLDLQKGAKKIASAENIVHVQLPPDSTRYEYVLRFLEKVMIGLEDRISVRESVEIEVRDKDGRAVGRERGE